MNNNNIITKEWLEQEKSCPESYPYLKKQKNRNWRFIAKKLYAEKKYDWCLWLLYRKTTSAKLSIWILICLSYLISINIFMTASKHSTNVGFAIAVFAAAELAVAMFVVAGLAIAMFAVAELAIAMFAVAGLAVGFAIAVFAAAELAVAVFAAAGFTATELVAVFVTAGFAIAVFAAVGFAIAPKLICKLLLRKMK